MIYIALYRDDNLLVENPEAIHKVVELLSTSELILKLVHGLQDYLSCKVKFLGKND